ncbi:hypothetical protein EJB05_03839 [Eragrostis curvula]|uniref:Uncharacterized protein n=1 Tax=Eragrostis curvula TaxID=38414 RepID=A0A5J9W7U8_9POAL|nr:hypothetical protein EJB05_03839 [Eragrostis curvula]
MSSLTMINEVNLRRRDHHDDGRVTTTRSFSVEDDSVSQHDHGEVDLRQRFSLPAAGLNQVNRFQGLNSVEGKLGVRSASMTIGNVHEPNDTFLTSKWDQERSKEPHVEVDSLIQASKFQLIESTPTCIKVKQIVA